MGACSKPSRVHYKTIIRYRGFETAAWCRDAASASKGAIGPPAGGNQYSANGIILAANRNEVSDE